MNKTDDNAAYAGHLTDISDGDFDYAYVESEACIAIYDDMKSAPRVIKVSPAPTTDFIEALASKTYEQAKILGSKVPYTVIREVSENCIHAQFSEIVVSILDDGDTIRFSDQGPGISQKDKVQLPGFTSATEPMKHYIRGVGSGLPIVKDYLDFSHGKITIEDNIGTGAVITISMKEFTETPSLLTERRSTPSAPPLSPREKTMLLLFLKEGALGVTDISKITDFPPSSTYLNLTRLEEYGLIEKTAGQKRILTDYGYKTAEIISQNE